MPFLELSNLTLSGNLSVVAKLAGPEFVASEIAATTNTAKSFGFSIAGDDTKIIVGAYSAAKAAIYEYDGINWNKAIEYTKTGRYGFKVAIDGEWAAVTNTPTSGNGSVFIYRKVLGVWKTTEFATINAPSDTTGNGFASSVSLHNGTLVVGHRQANTVGGAHVYVFNGTAWVKQGGLLTVTPASTRSGTNQNLGTEVSISGDTMVAGGPGDTLGKGAGVAFVSKRTGSVWSDPVLIKPSTDYLDGYGWSVRARGNRVIVGAPYGNATDNIPGRAFLYDVTGASPVLEKVFTVKTDKSDLIQDTLSKTTDSLGWAVDVSADARIVAVGALNRDNSKGITYVYEKLNNIWSYSALPNSWLTASDAAASNRFGSAVVFTANGIVVGAYGKGAFYWFK